MKPTPARLLALWLTLGLVSLAHAHPGHDDHEFTWDFEHLAAHPVATILCLAVAGTGVWALTRRALKRRMRR